MTFAIYLLGWFSLYIIFARYWDVILPRQYRMDFAPRSGDCFLFATIWPFSLFVWVIVWVFAIQDSRFFQKINERFYDLVAKKGSNYRDH